MFFSSLSGLNFFKCNQLWPRYDSTKSAGYRDVALNLCLRTAAARELGVEMHVCEVQLMLLPFAEMKVNIIL